MKHGVEGMTKDALEVIVTKEVEDSEPEEEESSGSEMEVGLSGDEGEDPEVEHVKTCLPD